MLNLTVVDWLLAIWLIPALVVGMAMIWSMAGSRISGIATTGPQFMIPVVVMSLLWFIYLPRIAYKRWGSK